MQAQQAQQAQMMQQMQMVNQNVPQSAINNPMKPNVDKREIKNTPSDFNEQENMEILRGGLNIAGRKDDSNRNINDVKDPSQLGGSRYAQHQTKSGDKNG